MKYVNRYFWVGILLASLIAPSAQAGGLYLYELGTPDVGAAAAGWAARAQDASTVFTNPAGMTRLEKSELLVGVQPLYLHAKFSPDSNTTTSGSDGDASTWLPTTAPWWTTRIELPIYLWEIVGALEWVLATTGSKNWLLAWGTRYFGAGTWIWTLTEGLWREGFRALMKTRQ